MKHFHSILLTCCMLSAFVVSGQLEQKHWFFGDRQGLDFTTSGPVYDNSAFVNNTMDTQESCVTQSDPSGNLIFYSNGEGIWDGNHNLVATGIGGDQSSASGEMSVPDPANSNRYYLFLVSASQGAHYRIVTNLGGGSIALGPLMNFPSGAGYAAAYSEGVTAVAGCNNNSWIMVKGYVNGGLSLMSFSLTSSGLAFQSSIPIAIDQYYTSMEASPDGNHIALGAFSGFNRLIMADFDKFAGTFSNLRILGTQQQYGIWPYGLSFSPNSKLFYAYIEGSGEIYQFDVTDPNPASSAIKVGATGISGSQGRTTMQLGIDGKIYVPKDWSSQLCVINNPDIRSTVSSPNACNFSTSGPPVYNTPIHGGLPNMMDANKYTSFANTISYNLYGCLGAQFIPNVCAQNYAWDFGDLASGSANYSSAVSPSHTFTAPGTYTIKLNADGVIILTSVTINYNTSISGPDSLCIQYYNSASYDIGALSPGQTVSWSVTNGTPSGASNQPVFGVNWLSLPGTVTAVISDPSGCTSYASMTVYDNCVAPQCNCEVKADFKYDVKDDECVYYFTGAAKVDECVESVIYFWDFGDGTTYTGQFPQHAFPANGTYDVCLTVYTSYNGEKCKDTYCRKIEVFCTPTCDCKNLKPDMSYDVSEDCVYTFTGISGAPGCQAYTEYYWDFGDGTTSVGQNAGHVYASAGWYGICLTVVLRNEYGEVMCSETVCKEVRITCEGGCKCELKPDIQVATGGDCKITLTGSSGSPCANISGYYWYVNNSGPYTGQVLNYQLNPNTGYEICLFVQAYSGDEQCEDKFCIDYYSGDCNNTFEPMGTKSASAQARPALSLFPNPASNKVTVSYKAEKQEELLVTMRLADGRVVKQSAYTAHKGVQDFDLEIPAGVANGFVFVEISGDGGTYVEKVMILRN